MDRHGPLGRDRRLGEDADAMKRRLKNRLWMSVAVIAVVAGVTAAAVMAAQPASHRHAHHHRKGDQHERKGGQHKRKGGLLTTAASYLGATPTQVRTELGSGKSLAEIANATSGKSSHGLIEALEAADRQKLAAVAANLQARITAKVNRPGGAAAREGRAGGRHHRGTGQCAATKAGRAGSRPGQPG
jgi:hypothetical protein